MDKIKDLKPPSVTSGNEESSKRVKQFMQILYKYCINISQNSVKINSNKAVRISCTKKLFYKHQIQNYKSTWSALLAIYATILD